MKMLLIMNPGSRAGRGMCLWSIWEEGLRKAGVRFGSIQTLLRGDAFRAARSAKGFDVIVAVGGDGTINEVLDGIRQSSHPETHMGVLYAGTSPDFCRFHKIPIDAEDALKVLLSGNSRAVDVVCIRHYDDRGIAHTAHFCCSCNIGMGASVARHANRFRPYVGDFFGTAAGVLLAFASNDKVDLELCIDGEHIKLPETNNLIVAKNPHIASGLKLQLDSAPDDGNLWVIGVHGRSKIGMCMMLPRFYSGSAVNDADVFIRACRTISIQTHKQQEIEFDGDPQGMLPCDIAILPKALNLVVGKYD